MDFTSLLTQFSTNDNEQRKQAENQLVMVMNNDFPTFVLSMLQILVDDSKASGIRQISGALFKRAVSSFSGSILREKQGAWNNLDETLRSNVKIALLKCLEDKSVVVRNAAASAVSAIARIEIPMHLWNNLFDEINSVVQNPSVDIGTKVACIEAVGYICEDLNDNELDDTMSASAFLMLLYSLLNNQPTELRLEAIQALNKALFFGSTFLSVSEQCSRVMESIYNACQDPSSDIQHHALLCVNSIFYIFYDLVEPYFVSFYEVCESGVRLGMADIAIQACFTMSTLAEVEQERVQHGESIFGAVKSCGSRFIVTLCEAMTKQDESDDGETMTVSLAAATCLGSFSVLLGNDIVAIVWPFVDSNIASPNWHLQEAAVMTFGCLLTGPDPEFVVDLVSQGVALLINLVSSTSCIQVKDSTAWTLSQICLNHLRAVPDSLTTTLLNTLINSLDYEPRVSQHIAMAIGYICDFITQKEIPKTNLISPYYQILLEKLVSSSEKFGVANSQLRDNAAYALIALISCSAEDCEPLLHHFMVFVLQKCQEVMVGDEIMNKIKNVTENKEYAESLELFYLIVLVSLVERFNSNAEQYVASLAELAYHVLSSENSAVHNQALLLYWALVSNCGQTSLQFISYFMPFIKNAITVPSDSSMCRTAVTCFDSIMFTMAALTENCNEQQKMALFEPILAVKDELISSVLATIHMEDVNRDIIPDLFTVISDLFFDLGDFCLNYFNDCLAVSLVASNYNDDSTDEEVCEWMDKLYCSVVDVWNAMAHMARTKSIELVQVLGEIMKVVSKVVNCPTSSNQLIRSCVYMLRDLGAELGDEAARYILNCESVSSLLVRCADIDEESAKCAVECRQTLTLVMKHAYSSW